MNRGSRQDRRGAWESLTGELWTRASTGLDATRVKGVVRESGRRRFGDDGEFASEVTARAALHAVHPQIAHAVDAAYAEAAGAEETAERRLDAATATVTAPADGPRVSDAWGVLGLVSALVAVAVLGYSSLIGSDRAILATPDAIVFSAAAMLVSLAFLVVYERGRTAGRMFHDGLFPARQLLIVPVVWLVAVVLAVIRLMIDPFDATPLAIVGVVVQVACVVAAFGLWRTARRHDDAVSAPPAAPPRLDSASVRAVDQLTERARRREAEYLGKLSEQERLQAAGLQLHALRSAFEDDRLTEAGLRSALESVRARWNV